MRLDSARVDAYLSRLRVQHQRCDLAGLAELQRAHLEAVPFHNLLLLANDGATMSLPPLLEVVDGAIEGIGGNCDRTTPAFAALLRALGYDAHLVAARVQQPGDHFACYVHIDGVVHLCDVGNGHPYLEPWRLDIGPSTQTFEEWTFRFEPDARNGPTLSRRLDGGTWKTVYVVDPAPRRYEDFSSIVEAHYTRPGFGPFLTGLRAARLWESVFLTLRDDWYVRDSSFGRSRRRVAGRGAFHQLLTERFGLPSPVVERALDVVARRRPELLTAPSPARRATRAEVPDVLVCAATVGRWDSLRRLLDSLARERSESAYPGRVGVLLVDLSTEARGRPELADAGLPLVLATRSDVSEALSRSAATGVIPPLTEGAPVPIGVAREASLAALRAHLRNPQEGLPHPASHPTVVWLVDDDLCFAQLGEDGSVRRRTDLLFDLAWYWATLTGHGVLLGGFTGDPPVPALDSLGGQLGDLVASIDRMLEIGMSAAWDPETSEAVGEGYYDLAEGRDGEVGRWPYAPVGDHSAWSAARALLVDLPRLLEGKQLTRALRWNEHREDPRPSLRRGGNVVYLDLDALFRWPTPALTCADGVCTRRADTIWATLTERDAPGEVAEVTLPLHHDRSGQSLVDLDVVAETTAQVRGVALARALGRDLEVGPLLRAREQRVRDQRAWLLDEIAKLEGAVRRLVEASGDELSREGEAALSALSELRGVVAAAVPIPGDLSELEAFLARLPNAVARWRRLW